MKVSHLKSPLQNCERFLFFYFYMGICSSGKHCRFMRSQRTFSSESIKNASHSLTSCYVPSLCDSVVFRSFLTSVCLSLFGSGDRSTCSTLLLPWRYPGHLSALQSYDSSLPFFSVLLFLFFFFSSPRFSAHHAYT